MERLLLRGFEFLRESALLIFLKGLEFMLIEECPCGELGKSEMWLWEEVRGLSKSDMVLGKSKPLCKEVTKLARE